MGAVSPNELARLWAQEQLPTERAVGQMLQQLVAMQSTIERQAQTIADMRAQIADLLAQAAPQTTISKEKKQGKIKG